MPQLERRCHHHVSDVLRRDPEWSPRGTQTIQQRLEFKPDLFLRKPDFLSHVDAFGARHREQLRVSCAQIIDARNGTIREQCHGPAYSFDPLTPLSRLKSSVDSTAN